MNKNLFAKHPPMGWNSYDYYDTTVTEEAVRTNADYMAEHLKEYGWEYIIIDIQWYAYGAGTMREKYQYIPFGELAIDEYSRLIPCQERFPSAANGAGFRPLADYIHSLGLKFGIHIMRGIPRIAAHHHMKILGSESTANDIANPSSICGWNPDMYGVNPNAEGAQEYYNSLFELYASWGVDFIKCDDICNTNLYPNNPYSAKEEIELIHKAILHCNRPIVLSLSPGPALIEKAWHYEKYANMWRITDDFWDDWALLLNMFNRCELWQNHVSIGCYPDCDMLPLGYLGKGFGKERKTNFTTEEQKTMMTLWCIFRSPLMIGAELTKLDPYTISLLRNKNVLQLLSNSHKSMQVMRDNRQAVWYSKEEQTGDCFIALFNLTDEKAKIGIEIEELNLDSIYLEAAQKEKLSLKELWTREMRKVVKNKIEASIPGHGTKLYEIIIK